MSLLFIMSGVFCTARRKPENDTDFEFVFGQFLLNEKEEKKNYDTRRSFEKKLWCFLYRKPENDTDFEFVFGQFLLLNFFSFFSF